MSVVVEVSNLTKYYGKVRGVEDLSFAVERGQIFGFLGPNGAGKTTTIRCLLGMLKPTSGESSLFGERVRLDGAAQHARIGYVPGEVFLYEKETGCWLIDYIARFRGARGPLEEELIERLEFEPDKKVKTLSKGNKQKLALVLGLMHDPELLILDEPTSGLDPLNQEEVFDILRERIAAGTTVLLSSHILYEVEKVCDRVGIIREDRLVTEEDVRGLLAKRTRNVSVTFVEPTASEFLSDIPGVTEVEAVDASSLRAVATGDAVDALLKRLAQRPVRDVEIERQSLEQVFMEYYAHEHAAETGGEPS